MQLRTSTIIHSCLLLFLFLSHPTNGYSNNATFAGKSEIIQNQVPRQEKLIQSHMRGPHYQPLRSRAQSATRQKQKEVKLQEEQERQLRKEQEKQYQREQQQRARAQKRKQLEPILKKQLTDIPTFIKNTDTLQNSLYKKSWQHATLAKRTRELKEYKENPNHWYEKSYHLSSKARQLLDSQSILFTEYTKLYASKINHVVHDEVIAIVHETAQLQFQNTNLSVHITTCIVNAAETSRLLNHAGNCAKAFQINDFCLSLLNPERPHYLVCQLAKNINGMHEEHSSIKSKWQASVNHLEKAGTYEKTYATLVTAAQTYAQIFQKTNSEVQLQIIQVITETCYQSLINLPATQQFNLLERHHEAVCMQAIRSLLDRGYDAAKTEQWTRQILASSQANDSRAQEALRWFIHATHPAERIKQLLNRQQYAQVQDTFFNSRGILKEYTLSCELNDLDPQLASQKETSQLMHNLLHQFQYPENSDHKTAAQQGLRYIKKSAAAHCQEIRKSYQNLAHKQYNAILVNQNDEISGWNEYLDQTYEDEEQNKVHQELVWFTEKYIDAAHQPEDATQQRLVDYIENTLEAAFIHNLLEGPSQAHELLTQTVQVLTNSQIKHDQCAYENYSNIDLKQIIKDIAKKHDKALSSVQRRARGSSLKKQYERIFKSCSELCVKSGMICFHYGKKTHNAQKKRSPETLLQLPTAPLFGYVIEQTDDPYSSGNKIATISYMDQEILNEFKQTWPEPDELNEAFETWSNELELYDESYSQLAQERYIARCHSYEKVKHNPYVFIKQIYEIPEQSEELLQVYKIPKKPFTQGTHNPYQHQLHGEFLDILEKTSFLDTHQEVGNLLEPATALTLKSLSTAVLANNAGDVVTASFLADFCWALADCGQAVLEGVLQGTLDAASFITNHPGEMILFAVAPEAMLTYHGAKLAVQAGKLGLDMGYAGYDKLFGTGEQFDAGIKQAETWFDNLTLHDSITNVTAFCTQCFLLHKVNQKLIKYTEPLNSKNPFMEPKKHPKSKLAAETTQPKRSPNDTLHKASKRKGKRLGQQKNSAKVPLKPFKSFKKELERLTNDKDTLEHIFSRKHKAKGILNFGKNEQEICEKAVSKIMNAHQKGLLKEGLNQNLTDFNNLDATIRMFVKNGKPISMNIWINHATRKLGNTFKL